MADEVSDVVVVGGGLVGAAIALGLARAGLAVRLLDEGDVAFRASRGNFGLAWAQGKGAGFPEYAGWSREAAALWPDFARGLAEETGIDLGFRQPGGFDFCLSEAEFEARRRLLQRMHNQQPDDRDPTVLLDAQEVRERLPAIGPAVVGASFCPLDGQVNPLYLLRALNRAVQALGGRQHPGHRVERIARSDDGFALDAGGGRFNTRRVVLAAGLGNRRLAPMIGLAAPVAPVRGQILVTERLPRFLDHPTLHVRQTEEGTVMLGDSHEAADFDVRTRVTVIGDIARRALLTFPRLADVLVVRAWAALRVMPPDGCPIYQESAAMPGAFVVCCHSGVTLAPMHATRIAPAIAAGDLDQRYPAFSGQRFDVPRAS